MIRKKSNLIILCFILILLILSFMCSNGIAKNPAKLSFAKEPTYELTNTIRRGGKTIGWSYDINVYIKNSGDVESKETLVNLSDNEGFVLEKYVYIEPGETKTITFSWSTVSERDQTIHVTYLPADKNADTNEFNKDITSFKIIIEGEDGIPAASTPGFEVILIILSLFCIIGIKKRIKK